MVGPPRSGLPTRLHNCLPRRLGLRDEVSRGLQRGLRCGHRVFPGEARLYSEGRLEHGGRRGGVHRRGAAAV